MKANMFPADQGGVLGRLLNRAGARWLLAGLGVAAALTAVSAAVFGISLPFEQGQLTTAAVVEHTNSVADAARRTLFGVRDAESSRQAYSLTHNPADLEAYRTELAGVKRNLVALQDLTRDIPVQQERLSRLRDL